MQTRVIGGSLPARVLALLLRQQVIACARCGFRGRQPRRAASRHGGAPGAVAARAGSRIDLEQLDRALEPGTAKKPLRQKGD